MHFISRTIVVMAAFSLVSCGETRHENPAFFEKKTGLPLCQSAKITNKAVGDHDFETDFVYSVNISMERQCEEQLISEIRDRLDVDCNNLDYCNFMDQNSWSYEIQRINESDISFTLRAT